MKALILLIAVLIALAASSEHGSANAGLPLVNAAAPITTCTPPILDYSRRMVRLDGKSIA